AEGAPPLVHRRRAPGTGHSPVPAIPRPAAGAGAAGGERGVRGDDAGGDPQRRPGDAGDRSRRPRRMTPPILILASGSPRRRELLQMLGIAFEVRPSHIPEEWQPGEAPVAYAERLAREKALSVPGALVLGADTTVLLDGQLLEKPADAEDALRILRRLQGRTHEVI